MKCKIGDLCFIIKAHHPENIGRVVSVVSEGTIIGWWVIESSNKLKASFIMDGSPAGPSFMVQIRDEWLKPIRDDEFDPSTDTYEDTPSLETIEELEHV